MSVRRKKHYADYKRRMKRAQGAGVWAAGTALQRWVKRAVSTPAGATSVPVQRQTPGGNKRSRTRYLRPSRPGHPPHLRSGNLMRHIFHDHSIRAGVSRVGWRRNAIYGYYHEMGIHYANAGFQRRPHLLTTLKAREKRLKAIMTRIIQKYMR